MACLLAALDAEVEAKGEAGEVAVALRICRRRARRGDRAPRRAASAALYRGAPRAGREDRADYQTMFAAEPGAVAAPTAGLHFTPALVERIAAARRLASSGHAACRRGHLPAGEGRGHERSRDALRRRARSTPRPRGAQRRASERGTHRLRRHDLRPPARERRGRGGAHSFVRGETSIFITPGYRFRAVDVLMTNFHLPRSTLLMLASAFSGLETIRRAYAHAIEAGYRFYSYGDACLLYRA